MSNYAYRAVGILLIIGAFAFGIYGFESWFTLGDILLISTMALGMGVLLLAVTDMLDAVRKRS